MTDEITLATLFQLQDEALNHNRQNSAKVQRQLDFIGEAVALACSVLTSIQFPAHKQTVIRTLGGDALSSIVVSVRLGLWGDLPESVALLRSGLETCSILGAVVALRQYEVATYEIEASRLKRFSYEDAVSQLGDVGSRIKALHGRLSDVGAHSSGTRMKFASYELNGQRYDRLGASLDSELAELALSCAPDVCLHLLASFEDAYSQDSLQFSFESRLDKLRTYFGRVKAWEPDATA